MKRGLVFDNLHNYQLS